MRLLGILMGLVVLLSGCGSASREVQFFNDTVDWTYRCLPLGQTFEIEGEWSDEYLPNQTFTARYAEGDMFSSQYLDFEFAATGEGQSAFTVTLEPLSRFGVVRTTSQRRGGFRLVADGPTAFGVWDFDRDYALISVYPDFGVTETRDIERCEYLAPARYRGRLD